MGRYERATICLNGHVISYNKANAETFCSQCGQPTFSMCTKCGLYIRGKYQADGIVDLTGYYEKPYYCPECGEPYPWTQKILDNALEILSLEEEISEETKSVIKNALPDLMVETPSTPVAVAKYKKGMSKVGETVVEAMRQLLVDVLCEMAKKSLFP